MAQIRAASSGGSRQIASSNGDDKGGSGGFWKPINEALGLDAPDAPSFKRGGVVKKTGLAKVHKGERVLTKAQQKRLKKK